MFFMPLAGRYSTKNTAETAQLYENKIAYQIHIQTKEANDLLFSLYVPKKVNCLFSFYNHH